MSSKQNKKRRELDRLPWSSTTFSFRYDDTERYPWLLIINKNGIIWSYHSSKYGAHREALRMERFLQIVQN